MASLPKLPGFTFHDPTSPNFHLSQTFDICNGYKKPKILGSGVVSRELKSRRSAGSIESSDPVPYDPSLTYGRGKAKVYPQFIPRFALYDQKCLTFKAFFKQPVSESPLEIYRVRPVNIIYFLEDDTISIMEPKVENSGLSQGKLLRRGRIPKGKDGGYWHWRDLEIGTDLTFYGIVYHTVDCDLFTREYMTSQGLNMSDPEEMPHDPYIFNRYLQVSPKVTKTPSADDKLRRFLEYDGKVLKFKALWDDRTEYGDLMKFEILYFLADDTVMVKNAHEDNRGSYPYPVLLRKTKLPKNYTDVPTTYPAIYLEKSDNEIAEYYQPKDFLVGNTICVLGRDMVLYDCDNFTRDYFKNALCIEQKPPVTLPEKGKPENSTRQLPPHDGLGSLEDSQQNTLTLTRKTPKKDFRAQFVNANKYLRYEMKMDFVHPEDKIRRFILQYSLADGTCKIHELPINNSGIVGGRYLRSTLLAKPKSNPLNPDLYTPADFYIGATIIVFGRRFIVTGADLYVYRYIQENISKFPCEVVENIRAWMFNQGYLKEDIEELVKENLEGKRKFDER